MRRFSRTFAVSLGLLAVLLASPSHAGWPLARGGVITRTSGRHQLLLPCKRAQLEPYLHVLTKLPVAGENYLSV